MYSITSHPAPSQLSLVSLPHDLTCGLPLWSGAYMPIADRIRIRIGGWTGRSFQLASCAGQQDHTVGATVDAFVSPAVRCVTSAR